MSRTIREKEALNYGLLLPVFLLILTGFIAQYGAFYADPAIENSQALLIKQGVWTLLGLLAMGITIFIPLKYLWKLTPFIYGLSLLFLVLLIPLHDSAMATITNTKRWLRLGPLTFQPSELMKVGYILFAAYIITQHNLKYVDKRRDGLLLLKLSISSLPVLLLMAYQRDFGTSMVFISIFLGMLVISGCSWKLLAILFGSLAFVGVSGILLVLTEEGQKLLQLMHFKPYQFNRIFAWLNPYDYADSISFQQVRGLMAIGSGGLFGKGLHGSTVYVPVRESDMIFTVIAEAFGFLGSAVLLLLFFYLIYQMLVITLRAEKEFYVYITTGVTMYFLFHIIENIGAAIGLLPLTGIPLPFLSQGGTAYLVNFIAIGLILSMHWQQQQITLKERQ